MRRLKSQQDINAATTIPPEVSGLVDWTVREMLYTHTQTTNSFTWNVKHNLENNPSIFVYVYRLVNGLPALTLVLPEAIDIIDPNNTRVTFNQSESGIVQCVSLSSQNMNAHNTSGVSSTIKTDMQVTNRGELTIATLDPIDLMSISTMFNSPASPQPIVIQYLNVSNNPGILSPWSTTKVATINGKNYYIRSFNVVANQPAPIVFQSGLVADSSTMYFPNSSGAGQMLILLANNPQASADRIYDRYCDTTSINSSTTMFYYNNGELFASQSVIKNTYPPIIAV
jgi:hypothetical protein